MLLTPGQTNDSPPPLDAVVVPRRTPEVVIADRAYSAASNRSLLCHKRIQLDGGEFAECALSPFAVVGSLDPGHDRQWAKG
ncbi:hypothetical protein ACWEPH_06050 [Nocardia beijingensis]